MSEQERLEKLNQLFHDYISYLIFMAKQIMGPSNYGHFSLIKALEKMLEIQRVSEEIKNNELYDQIRSELQTVERVSSSELEKWEPFLEKLIELLIQEM